ncbi:MAG: RHS repeat-associated core domain-containing protein, partial [Albidovulum sp.]
PLAVVEGGQIYLVRADHIGRPIYATTMAGTKVWEASYLPFGGVHVTTGAPIDLRFPGQWFQAESGLYQNWMRDYDPTTGRYLQADPLGLVDGASVYGYARGNPVTHYDFLGLYDMGGTTAAGGVTNTSSSRTVVAVDMDNNVFQIVRPGETLPNQSNVDWDMVWDGEQCYKVYLECEVTDSEIKSYARRGIRIFWNTRQKYNPFKPLPNAYCRSNHPDFPDVSEGDQ